MTRTRRARVASVVLAAVLTGWIAIGPAGSPDASAQELPPLPPLPDELDPLLEALSPTVWTACDALGLTSTLLLVLGLPTEINDATNVALGPVLGLCSLVPVPLAAPECAIDENIPPLGGLGRPIAPGAVVANQADALDALFARLLGQMTTRILGPPLHAALGCAPAPIDTSPPPPEGTLPPIAGSTSDAPAPPAGEPMSSPPGATRLPMSPAAPTPPVSGVPVPGRTQVASPPIAAASTSPHGWNGWRVVLVALALVLGGFGLPRVSFPNGRFPGRS